MAIKEKMQEWKDIRKVRKNITAIKDVVNQTEKVIFAAFEKHGPEMVPYIKNLTPDLYGKLEEYCLWCMDFDTTVLSKIPGEKLTQEICVEAVKYSLFDDIPVKFRNYEVYLESVKHLWRDLEKVPKEYYTEELCKVAVQNHASALQWVPVNLQTNAVYEEAFKSNENLKKKENLLQYMDNQTEEVCLRGVEQNGLSLENAKYQNEKICLTAVLENGMALQYVQNQTKKICFAAVEQNKRALSYVKDDGLALLAVLYAQI